MGTAVLLTQPHGAFRALGQDPITVNQCFSAKTTGEPSIFFTSDFPLVLFFVAKSNAEPMSEMLVLGLKPPSFLSLSQVPHHHQSIEDVKSGTRFQGS